jgi:hypothetical protein
MQSLSSRAAAFTDSVIRRMTRICMRHGAINLAQGFPDFDPPAAIMRRLAEVAASGSHRYSVTWGAPGFRRALAEKQSRFMGRQVDPEDEIVVTCGSTEAMMAAMLTVTNPGDKVALFSPFSARTRRRRSAWGRCPARAFSGKTSAATSAFISPRTFPPLRRRWNDLNPSVKKCLVGEAGSCAHKTSPARWCGLRAVGMRLPRQPERRNHATGKISLKILNACRLDEVYWLGGAAHGDRNPFILSGGQNHPVPVALFRKDGCLSQAV